MIAARFWTNVLAAELVLALIVGSIGAARWSLSGPTTIMVVLAALLSVHIASIGLSFLLASTARRRQSLPDGRQPLRALLTELIWFGVAQLRMIVEPDRRSDHGQDLRPPDGSRPVLLLHGFACNRGSLRRLQARLCASGYGPVQATNLEPLCADLDSYVVAAAHALHDMQSAAQAQPVVIIGHSMGGLVARALLRVVEPGLIRQIVTVATPHHGTRLALRIQCPAARQMRPGSPWLQALNDAQENKLNLPLISIYSLDDNIVAPAGSALLAGAQQIAMSGLGHFGLLGARDALDAILRALEPGAGSTVST